MQGDKEGSGSVGNRKKDGYIKCLWEWVKGGSGTPLRAWAAHDLTRPRFVKHTDWRRESSPPRLRMIKMPDSLQISFGSLLLFRSIVIKADLGRAAVAAAL